MYEETSKNILVHTVEAEDDKDIEPDDKFPDELEDQEEFQKPQPTRQAPYLLKHDVPASYSDRTNQSVLYSNKDVRIHVINIDSKFRFVDQAAPSSPYDFTFRFKDVIKNVISMKISGIEIPNTMHVFKDEKKNTSFLISVDGGPEQSVPVEEGNYEDVCSLIQIIQDKLNALYPSADFVLEVSEISSKLTITSLSNFTLSFPGITESVYQNGMGYHLGFKNNSYSGQKTYTSENVVNTIEGNYMFLSLGPNYKVISHRVSDTDIDAFAKILINVPKNAVVFDTNGNIITREYFFKYPTNLASVPVSLIDEYGNTIDLQGCNFSFTLEITEIINHGLYNLFSELNS
jgi:hypothetical protein